MQSLPLGARVNAWRELTEKWPYRRRVFVKYIAVDARKTFGSGGVQAKWRGTRGQQAAIIRNTACSYLRHGISGSHV